MDLESDETESNEMPVELMRQTPRNVRLTSTGWLNIFAAALFFAVGVGWGVSAVRWVVNDMTAQDALRQAGRDSSAQVINKWTTRSVPYLSYTFSVDGTFYTGKSRVPRETWNRLRQDDSLPIRYLPANPDINHPAGWEDATISNLGALLFPVGLAIFGAMFVRRIPLQRRIAVEGIAVRGCVSEREWKGPSKGQTYVDYTFRNATNDEVEIGSCPYDFPPKGGSNVWVLYLPTNPRRSEIYPFGIDFFRIE